MELLTSLEEKLKDGLLPIDEVIKLGIHICRMLEVCEKQNIIHRDIKPANIFVTEYGDYKLGDFGIARTLQDGSASTSIGTMDFIAPEVASYRQRYDSRVDIYSLGLTLYYLLNGNKLPFEGEDNEESPLVRRIDGEPLPQLKGISERLSYMVLKASSFKPNDRYSNIKEMLFELSSLGISQTTPETEHLVQGDIIRFDTHDWRVLEVKPDKVFVLSERVIEYRSFHGPRTVVWGDSHLRHYLNGEFLDKFNIHDKELILITRGISSTNPRYPYHRSESDDRIFLLSIEEVLLYFGDREGIRKLADKECFGINDQYNQCRIAYDSDFKASRWWLRSDGPGIFANYVDEDGSINLLGIRQHRIDVGVRPAMWLKLNPEQIHLRIHQKQLDAQQAIRGKRSAPTESAIIDSTDKTVNSVVHVFVGQPKHDNVHYMRDIGEKSSWASNADSFDEMTLGYKNGPIILTEDQILANIQAIQNRSVLRISHGIRNEGGTLSLGLEMKDDAKKAYITTILELDKVYGWSKYLIVVPNILVRDSVKHSIEVSKGLILERYGKSVKSFVYDSSKLFQLDEYSQYSGICILIMNWQLFSTDERIGEPRLLDTNTRRKVIFEKHDTLGSRKPIDIISANNPIVIFDGLPKDRDSVTMKAIKQNHFKALFSLSYLVNASSPRWVNLLSSELRTD